jgi:predicted amino acid racemase
VIPLLDQISLPETVNHWRIGEAAFLGTDLINQATLPGFRDDVFTLHAEVAEIKQKSMNPTGETADITPFGNKDFDIDLTPGQRGFRALLTVGELDTDVGGLVPLREGGAIVGASSDLTVVHLDDEQQQLQVGDTLAFRMNYSALLRLMNDRYVPKQCIGLSDSMQQQLKDFRVGHVVQEHLRSSARNALIDVVD